MFEAEIGPLLPQGLLAPSHGAAATRNHAPSFARSRLRVLMRERKDCCDQ